MGLEDNGVVRWGVKGVLIWVLSGFVALLVGMVGGVFMGLSEAWSASPMGLGERLVNLLTGEGAKSGVAELISSLGGLVTFLLSMFLMGLVVDVVGRKWVDEPEPRDAFRVSWVRWLFLGVVWGVVTGVLGALVLVLAGIIGGVGYVVGVVVNVVLMGWVAERLVYFTGE